MKAAPLLRAWLRKLDGAGVHFAFRHRWLGFEGDTLVFEAAGERIKIAADATLLALGGASWPRLGSDGQWSEILAQAGVKLAPLQPANGGFTVNWSDYFSTRFAGQPLKPVALQVNGVKRQGEAMLTKQGIEGGVVYALSGLLREELQAKGTVQLSLDLRPDMTAEALTKKLETPRGSKSFTGYLGKAGLSPLVIALLHEVIPAEQLKSMPPAALATTLKALPLTLTGTTGLARAISTAGGVTREAVTEGFMLRAKPGIFVAGEMLDWEAPTGGYLLQACFSTAFTAAGNMKFFLQ